MIKNGDSFAQAGSSTPLQPFVHSESKQPLHPSMIGGIHSGGYSYPSRSREQVPIESSRQVKAKTPIIH